MKRTLSLASVLVLSLGLSAQAAVILQVGDIIKYDGQATNESEGNGGAFNWNIAYDVSSPVSSPVGTTFQSFCTQLTQSISSSDTVTALNSNLGIGSALDTSGNTLQNMKGLYLFDLWSKGLLNPYFSSDGTKNVAASVQVEIWLSEGYTTSQIASNGGISGSALLTATADAAWFVNNVSDSGTSYTSGWTPTDIQAVDLDSYPSGQGAQDQVVLIPTSGTSSAPAPSTPEPASMLVWGIGAGVAGAAAVRRRKQRRPGWTKQNRQAILSVIDRGRQQQSL